MADASDKSAESAEKAYAEAAAQAKPVAAEPVVPAPMKAEASKAPTPDPVKKIRKAAPKKAAPKPTAAQGRSAKPATAVKARKPAQRRVSKPQQTARVSTVSELKEKIMATAKTTDFTMPINQAIGEFQNRAKAAYEKSTEALSEATEFAKGNVEAIVESGKIIAGGAQDLGKTYVEEAKGAYETFTADLKEFAAVKSPTELFQLQGKIARRNFDALVATSSKNTEAMMKLASEAFAPISGRVNVAAEKLAKVA